MPENDKDFSTRWRLIKRYFSMETDTLINHRKEKEVWQRRFWEHRIDEELEDLGEKMIWYADIDLF